MGNREDLWDDSALVRAYEDAIYNHKTMHKLAEAEVTHDYSKKTLPAPDVGGSDEHIFNTEILQHDRTLKKKNPSESYEYPSSGPTLNKYAGESSLNSDVVSSDVKSKDEVAWYSSSQEEYSKLLEKYYDIDYQRQSILQQLNQYTISRASYPGRYESSPPQPLASLCCSCSYGCQNWAVPCTSSSAPCIGDTGVYQSCGNTRNPGREISLPNEGSDFVKTAMDAAKIAVSSLNIGTPCNPSLLGKEGGKNDVGRSIDVTEGSVPSTDLAVVLNAWYSAGFYTGKYLSEQSLEKRKHS